MRRVVLVAMAVVLIVPLTATVGSTQAAVSDPTVPDWLNYINAFRATAAVSPFTENTDFSQAATEHAQYIVETDDLLGIGDPGNVCEVEDAEGAPSGCEKAAFRTPNIGHEEVINYWMSSAFHTIFTLNPLLLTTGYGSFEDASSAEYKFAAALVTTGVTTDRTYLHYPIMWPGPNSTIGTHTLNPFENPDALTSCPGYTHPAGFPITLQLRDAQTLVSTQLLKDGVPAEHCSFDATTYTNPDPAFQQIGRDVLSVGNAAAVIPRQELTEGSVYTVTFTVNGGAEHTWSFTAGAETHWSDQVVVGSQTAESLTGTTEDDAAFALGGDDVLDLGGGDDRVYAGIGNDTLTGGIGNDLVNGEAGTDDVQGGGGNDRLYGKGGKDKLKGGKGFDKLNGGAGLDVCIVDSRKEKRAAKNCEKIQLRRGHL